MLAGFTMITNPDYREDPWKESLRQALLIFDKVVVVYGDFKDYDRLIEFSHEIKGEKLPAENLEFEYLEWPQPEWSYEELPRHLNKALEMCRALGADWAVKFDIDFFVHENEKATLKYSLAQLQSKNIILATFEKYQFFLASRGYEKGKLPLAVNLKYPVCYGQDETRYTDLCQPILPGEGMVKLNKGTYEIPKGKPVDPKKIASTGVHVWNYDYTFKTLERAKELLYHFDRSHAKWWSAGYHGKALDQITPESALEEYIFLVKGRITKCIYSFRPELHPKYIRPRLENIKPEEFGHSLWNKIPLSLLPKESAR